MEDYLFCTQVARGSSPLSSTIKIFVGAYYMSYLHDSTGGTPVVVVCTLENFLKSQCMKQGTLNPECDIERGSKLD